MNIDTLAIARDLRATELPAAQAEAIATAIGRSLSEGVATKSDIEIIVQKIDALGARIEASERTLGARIDMVDAQLTAKIEGARSSLLIWLMGVIIATAGALMAVLKY